ncbi:MAG: sensor histidine kinase [Propionibacteriaceae bacterium]
MLGVNLWTAEIAEIDRAWFSNLIDSWQLLADLSFSDVVLWVPHAGDSTLAAIAQARPATGPTALPQDIVGYQVSDAYDPVAVAYRTKKIVEALHRAGEHHSGEAIPADVRAIPILRDGCLVGIVSRHTNRLSSRSQGRLESVYLEVTNVLEAMLNEAHFPFVLDDPEPLHSPNVGDGVIRLDRQGSVTYASPNAQTAFRRLGLEGQFEGERFSDVAAHLVHDREPIDQARLDVHEHQFLDSRVFDLTNAMATVRVQVIPLVSSDYLGALVLARDTTDIRTRERQLLSKEATIREIHHRVKNNLQTVSALLRLQSRRIESEEARSALAKAQQRVSAIGVVHELLSQSYDDDVDFDGVCDRLLALASVVTPHAGDVQVERQGSFGVISGDAATPLSLIISELCQNAADHGLAHGPGKITVYPRRSSAGLELEVRDTGSKGQSTEHAGGSGLGLNIVSTLAQELGGTFDLDLSEEGATARVAIPAERIDARREDR